MAKLTPDVQRELEAGYAATGPHNPHLWSSRMWEAWELGRFLALTGRSLNGIEKARGDNYRSADGFTYRANYNKAAGGGSFGFSRVA